MGGVRITPDMPLADLRPEDSAMLILAGADTWLNAGGNADFADKAREFLEAGVPVAGIARAMGITRQGVQRIADLLVAQGLAEYVPNPAPRRAKLLRPTPAGYDAIGRIDPGHAALAKRLAEEVGSDALESTLDALTRLSAALDAVAPTPPR
jgi:DNA-binding MarR family transcriptional regulator